MSINSRYGCPVKDLAWKVWPDGTISNEIVIATREDDNLRKEYHISDLRADGGIAEIVKALQT